MLANSNTALATRAAHRWRGLSIVRIETRQTVATEMARMRRLGADLMIVRDAGGILDAKLTAARRLKVPVWIIDRPAMPQVPIFKSPSALLNYLGSARAGV